MSLTSAAQDEFQGDAMVQATDFASFSNVVQPGLIGIEKKCSEFHAKLAIVRQSFSSRLQELFMSGRWMLVVDDNPDHAFLATRVIAQHDPMIAVEICESGAKALRALETMSGNCPEAIFVDVGLHNESGLVLIDRIRAVEGCSGVPIVVLTSSVNDDTRIDALLHEASAYICKPLTVERLESMLQGKGFHWDMRDLPADLGRYHRKRRERDASDASGV